MAGEPALSEPFVIAAFGSEPGLSEPLVLAKSFGEPGYSEPFDTPSVDFIGTPTAGLAPLTVSFTHVNDSSVPFDTFFWEFGDGDTSTDPNPTHEYLTLGTFTVKLTVTATGFSDVIEEKTDYITVFTTVEVDFTGTPQSGPAPLTVQFQETLNFAATSFLWDFGDPDSGIGNIATTSSPVHEYETPGLYTVSLTVSSGTIGPFTETKVDFIGVEVPVPVAAFSAVPVTGFEPLTVQFTNESTGFPETFLWDFGDGTTSIEENPEKTYASAGSFEVTLTATNVAGSNTSAPQVIEVLSIPNLVADYIIDAIVVDPGGSGGLLVEFVDQSIEALLYNWDFGDPDSGVNNVSTLQNPTHIFSGPGIFQVTLTVTHGPFTDTVCKNVLVTLDVLRFMEIWGTASFEDGSPVEPDRVVQVSSTGIDSGTDCSGDGTDASNIYKTVNDGGTTRYLVRARGNVIGIADSGFEDGEPVFISVGGRTATTTLPNPGVVPVSVPFFQTLPSVPSSVIELDLVFPLASTQAVPAGGTFNNIVEVDLVSNVTPATTWYTTDGSDPTFSPTRVLFDEPFTLEEGTTVLKFFTEDPLGPDEPVQEEVYIILPPTVLANPSAGDYSDNFFATLTGNRPGTIYYRVNQQGAFIKFDPDNPIPIEAGTSGIQTTIVEAYLIDDQGKTAPTQTFVYKVDLTKPVITSFTLQNGDTVTGSQIILVQVEASSHTNSVTGLLLSTFSDFSDAVVQLYNPEVAFLLPAPDGPKTVFVKVSDQFGVFSDTKSKNILLDTEIPVFTASSAPSEPIGESTFLFSGTKSANSGIFLTINGESEMLIVPFDETTTWEYEVTLAEGVNTLSFQVGTAVGNRSTNIEERTVDVRLIAAGVTQATTIANPDGTWKIPFVFLDERSGGDDPRRNLRERQHDFRLVVTSDAALPPVVTFPTEASVLTENVITVTGTAAPGAQITLIVEVKEKVEV